MNLSFFSWDKLSIRHRVSFFLVGMITLSFLGYLCVLLPQWEKINTLKTEYIAEQQKVTVVEAFLLLHPSPEKYLGELDTTLKQIDTSLPDSPDISSFLFQVKNLSTSCNVQLRSLKPGKLVNKEGYRMYDMEIIISGNFLESMNFISNMEKGLRFINITGTNMKLDKSGLETKISAKIYSFGIPAADSNNNKTGDK
jgi:Tfp pilus assembly protein PilO